MPLTLFAIPDEKAETNQFAIEIPDLGSLILTHDPNGTIRGLKECPADQRPPVAIPFFAFRIMVGIAAPDAGHRGVRACGCAGAAELFEAPWFLRLCILASPLGFIAVLAGWATTEVGRQPWTVYGLLRTANSVSPSLTGVDVLLSLLGYVVVYLLIFPAGVAADVADRPARPGAGRRWRPNRSKAGGRSAGADGAVRSPRRKRAMSQMLDFVPIWTLILGVGVFLYVLLDGFDLGVGMLYGFAPDRDARNSS